MIGISQGATKKTKVNFRLRPEELEHLDEVVDDLSGTRTELIRESIYLLIRLWNVYSAEYKKRDVKSNHAEFNLLLRSVNSNPDAVFGLKR